MTYIELHAASAFSFLDGSSLPEALIDRAAALGYPALALLDRDGVYGAPRFHLAAKKAGLKAIIGAELTISDIRYPISDDRKSRIIYSKVLDCYPYSIGVYRTKIKAREADRLGSQRRND